MKLAFASFTALALLFAKDAAAAERLKFTIPDGWVDLSPDAPAANIRRAPPSMIEAAKGAHFEIYAADLDHADDGFAENMGVAVKNGTPRITEASMATFGNELRDGVAAKGGTVLSSKTDVIVIGGVHVGRIESESRLGDVTVHQLQYLVPGEREAAIVSFTATPETFAAYLPVFEASVAGTQGMHEAKRGIDWGQVALSGAIGGVVAGLAAAFNRKKKKKNEAAITGTPERKEWWS